MNPIIRVIPVATAITASGYTQAHGEGSHFEIHSVQTQPTAVTEGQSFQVTLSGYNLWLLADGLDADPEDYTVTVNGSELLLNLNVNSSLCIDPTPPLPEDYRASRVRLTLEGLPAGEYSLRSDVSYNLCGRKSEAGYTRPLVVYEHDERGTDLAFGLENPRNNQVVSGVGLLRGWACYPNTDAGSSIGASVGTVSFRIDEDVVNSIPYGSSRADTSGACGDGNTDTGYGAVVYWGNYAPGDHTLTLLVDGEEVVTRRFTVVAPEEGFLRGLSADYTLDHFPSPGSSARVEWSQSDQNFIIVDFDN